MNKHDILSMLKSQILTLRDRSKDLGSNPHLKIDWTEKTKLLTKSLEGLNSCDMVWLNDQYGKWYDKEIKPHVHRLDSSLLKQIHS